MTVDLGLAPPRDEPETTNCQSHFFQVKGVYPRFFQSLNLQKLNHLRRLREGS